MIARILTLAGGLAGAAGSAQFPEYSQQYLQRLSGHVDELVIIINNFDESAARSGLTRDEALADINGSDFRDRHADDMARTIQRYDRLSQGLADFQGSSAYARLTRAPVLADPEIAANTMSDFEPALPVTLEGLVFAGGGFVFGYFLIGMIWSVLTWPFRAMRRRKT